MDDMMLSSGARLPRARAESDAEATHIPPTIPEGAYMASPRRRKKDAGNWSSFWRREKETGSIVLGGEARTDPASYLDLTRLRSYS